MSTILLLLIGVIILGIVVQLITQSLGYLSFGYQSKKWIPIQAEVIGYSVGLRTTYQKDSTVTSQGYEVNYTYAVSGVVYQSSGLGDRGFTTSECAEIEASRTYPIGRYIEIAYNSKNPQLNSSYVGSSYSSILLSLVGLLMGSGILMGCINMVLYLIIDLSKKNLLFESSFYSYVAKLGIIAMIPIFYASFILIMDTFQSLVNELQNSHPERRHISLVRLTISSLTCISTVVITTIASRNSIIMGLVAVSSLFAPFGMIPLALIFDLLTSKNSNLKRKNGILERRGHWLFNVIVGCLTFFLATALSIVFFQYPLVRVGAI